MTDKDKESNQGHWVGAVADPCRNFGFIYRIDVAETGQAYIGKRQYWKAKPKAVGCKSKVADKGSDKWKSSCWLCSDWMNYSGSSNSFTKFMKENPNLTYTFTIVRNCRSRGILLYSEAEYQWECKVLTKKLDNGEYKYFNRQIGGIKFRPKLLMSDDTKVKISKAMKGRKPPERTERKRLEVMTGRKTSDETKAKLSKALKGREFSEETKSKISKALKGKALSEDHKSALSKAQVGKAHPWNRSEVVYTFIKDNDIFEGTRWEFLNLDIGLTKSGINDIISKKQKTHRGWTVKENI